MSRVNKMVDKPTEVTTHIKCDGCGIVVEVSRKPKGWHYFSSGHNGWGNDSHESFEYHDVCSPKCMIIVFEKELVRLKGEHTAEICEMDTDFIKNLIELLSKPVLQ